MYPKNLNFPVGSWGNGYPESNKFWMRSNKFKQITHWISAKKFAKIHTREGGETYTDRVVLVSGGRDDPPGPRTVRAASARWSATRPDADDFGPASIMIPTYNNTRPRLQFRFFSPSRTESRSTRVQTVRVRRRSAHFCPVAPYPPGPTGPLRRRIDVPGTNGRARGLIIYDPSSDRVTSRD